MTYSTPYEKTECYQGHDEVEQLGGEQKRPLNCLANKARHSGGWKVCMKERLLTISWTIIPRPGPMQLI